MPSREKVASGNPDRAVQALDRGVDLAERGETDHPVVLVHAEDVRALSLPDLRARLDRIMLAPGADAGLDALLTSNVLETVLPEVQHLVGFGDGEFRHKDVWKHTKQVVAQAEARLEVRWAALFHDIGKIKTRTFGP